MAICLRNKEGLISTLWQKINHLCCVEMLLAQEITYSYHMFPDSRVNNPNMSKCPSNVNQFSSVLCNQVLLPKGIKHNLSEVWCWMHWISMSWTQAVCILFDNTLCSFSCICGQLFFWIYSSLCTLDDLKAYIHHIQSGQLFDQASTYFCLCKRTCRLHQNCQWKVKGDTLIRSYVTFKA